MSRERKRRQRSLQLGRQLLAIRPLLGQPGAQVRREGTGPFEALQQLAGDVLAVGRAAAIATEQQRMAAFERPY